MLQNISEPRIGLELGRWPEDSASSECSGATNIYAIYAALSSHQYEQSQANGGVKN